MPATTTADRLTFTWNPTWDRNAPIAVEVTETRPRSTKRTVYVVGEDGRDDGERVFLVAKGPDETGPRADEVYAVNPKRGTCTCSGSQCRHHQLVCRHRLAVNYLTNEGAL